MAGIAFALMTMLTAVLVSEAAPASASPGLIYLHGVGSYNNPPTLFLNATPPAAGTSKYKDSGPVSSGGGNAWQVVGIWTAAPSSTVGTLTGLDNAHIWAGLRNSDDQGTHFDVRAETLKNGAVIAHGLTRCVSRNRPECVIGQDGNDPISLGSVN